MKTSSPPVHLPSSIATRSPAAPRRRRHARAWVVAAGLGLALAPWSAAQPDCRSVLGAHLKPVTRESPIATAAELVTIPVYMEDRYANNTMLLAAIDFTSRSKTHQFYFEGGAKRSTVDAAGHGEVVVPVATTTESETVIHAPVGTGTGTGTGTGSGRPSTAGTGTTATPVSGETPAATEEESPVAKPATQTKYGWRELFYQYSAETMRLRTGLSTTRLGDYFLVNERVLGLSYRQQFAAVTVSAAAGSVGEFARMTDFCGTKRLTNLVDKEKYETVSEEFGDTNMLGTVVTWDLQRPTPAARSVAPKVGADEFALTDDLAPRRSEARRALSKVGLLAYHEYDRRTADRRTWLGALAQFELPLGWSLKAQGMYQDGNNDAFIVYGLAQKEFFWPNASNTSVHAGYFGKYNVGAPAAFEASFSNLFQGEIMRMDAIDIPLVFAGVRHNFASRRKLYAQLQGVEQLHAENMKEVDLEVGIDLFRRLRVAAIGSYVYSRATKERENYVAKMEVRLGF